MVLSNKSQRFDVFPTPLAGLMVIQRRPIEDERGSFCRFFCSEEFRNAGLNKPIVQVNHTVTKKAGAVRGLHFQYPPHAETKIVSCIKGEIFDVAVDLRKGSPTFLRWHGEKLSASNNKSLLIPEGFAHGFQAMTDDCEVVYLTTAPYTPDSEGGFNVQDPCLGIKWPLLITKISCKDKIQKFVESSYGGESL